MNPTAKMVKEIRAVIEGIEANAHSYTAAEEADEYWDALTAIEVIVNEQVGPDDD